MPQVLSIKNKIDKDEDFKVMPFKKDLRKTGPHKHDNYIEIVFLSKGSGTHYIDMTGYPIIPPVWFFIRQEQVHYWDITSEPEGYVAILRKTFIDKCVDSELKSLLTQISCKPVIQLAATSTIDKLFKLITEQNNIRSNFTFPISEGLLKSLFAKLLEVEMQESKGGDGTSELFHSFVQLLTSANGNKKSVAYYASRLNTTTRTLNAVCKKSVHKSATELMSEFVLNEARRLLLYSDETVSEIAYQLSFTDPSHFVKYFRKAIGKTPASFRKRRVGTII